MLRHLEKPLGNRPLALLVAGCCLFVLLASRPFQTYVMPNLHDLSLTLAGRVSSPQFGDSVGYGRYAEGIEEHRSLSTRSGRPILKHMPGLPLLLAVIYGATGSIQPFLLLQVVLLFGSLYLLLAAVRLELPGFAVAATPILIALHPQTIKHSAAVMSELTFGAMLLCVAALLCRREPDTCDFVLAGLVFGVAVYVRESALPFMLMTGLAYVILDRRRYLRPVCAMVVTFLVLLAPWVIRNTRLTGSPTLLTTKTSDLLYYSSIPLTPRLYVPLGPGLQEGGYDYGRLFVVYERETAKWAPPALGAPGATAGRSMAERFGSWADRPLPPSPLTEAVHNYLSRPAAQLGSLALKTIALLNKPPILAQFAATPMGALLVAANVGYFAFHIGVVLFGAFLAFTKHRGPFLFLPYWIAAQYAQALLLWSEHRYLMPMYPFFILLSLSYLARRASRS